MKTLVTYMTQTGNTKRIAEAIYGEITGEKDIKDIKFPGNAIQHSRASFKIRFGECGW